MLPRSLFSLPIVIALLALTPIGASAQIFVDQESPSGGDGTSWATAYNTLQTGLDAATSGDQVWVANGTYYPDTGPGTTANSRTASFSLPDGVTVIGGFTGYAEGAEQDLTERPSRFADAVTTLSGEIQQDGDATNNAYHVVTSRGNPSSTALRRVRVANGTANGTGEQGLGGGILLDGSDAKIINTYVQQNLAKRGAAIAVTEGAPVLQGLLANANENSDTGTIYLDSDQTTLNHLTVADNTTTSADGANGLYQVGSNASVYNTAYGTDTSNDVSPTVTATIQGQLTQEGQPLPDTEITLTNATADTSLGTTTTDSNGDYTTTTTYPATQTYTLELAANTDEHSPDQTTLQLAQDNQSYNASLDLERLVHDLTITTTDSETGESQPAQGLLRDPVQDTTLASYDTGSDATTTKTISTPISNVEITANNTNYDQTTASQSLGASRDISTALQLSPTQWAFTGTISDANNNALDNATASFDDPDEPINFSATTSTDGTYSVKKDVNDGVTKGETINITFSKPGYKERSTSVTAAENTTADARLEEKATTFTIQGDIDNQDGDNLAGDIAFTEPDGTTETISSNADGTYSADLSSNNSFEDGETIDIIASNVNNYQADTLTVTLDKDNKTKTAGFNLDVSTSTVTTTFNKFTTVGDDLFPSTYETEETTQTSDDEGLDQINVTSDIETETFKEPGQIRTITYGDTLSYLKVSQADNNFLDVWVMNNTTGNESAPDLRQNAYSSPPEEPDLQSNYGKSTKTGTDTINVAPNNLKNQYEARVIPDTSPRGYNTLSEYGPHIGDPALFNGINRWTDSGGYNELEIYVQQDISNDPDDSFQENADQILTSVLGLEEGENPVIPMPTDTLHLTSSEMLSRFNSRNGNNVMRIEDDSKSYSVFDEGRFIENSKASYSPGDNVNTAREEIVGGLSNLDDSSGPNIMNSLERTNTNGNTVLARDEARFVFNTLYSIHSTSQIE